MRSRVCALLVATLATPALATDSPTLARAIESFQRGSFAEVRTQLERLKTSSALSEPDQIELRLYLGATYHALSDTPRAYEEFFELFRAYRGARVDPELFVPAVVELAERAKTDAAGARGNDAPVQRSATLTPPPATVTTLSPLTFVPFGVGQFSRGETGRGAAFLAGQAALFIVAGVSLAMLETSKVESYGLLRGGTFRDPQQAQALNVTAFATFWAGVGVATWGVLDAALRPPVSAAGTR